MPTPLEPSGASDYALAVVLAEVAADGVPAPVVELCRALREAGHGAWVVGGCLRDLLLGLEVNDWDVATSAKPQQVRRVFRKVIPTGIAHGTVTVLWKGAAYEVTTLRGEGAYSDGRRPDEVFFVDDIEADLARRDFTMNAVAYDPIDHRLVDPFDGHGDLDHRLIRAVGRPEERFAEDGLRILRAARFVATLEFDLEPATRDAVGGALATFQKVSRERVQHEWLKTLKARRPSRAFEVMRDTGILEVTLPALLEQVGCEQNRWHAYDVWTHTMVCVDQAPADPVLRMAALLHDIGKPATRALSEKTGDHTFFQHEQVGAKMAERWLRDYRFSTADRELIVHLIRHHLVCYTDEWTDAAVRRFVQRVGKERVEPLLALSRADAIAKGRDVQDELAALDTLRARIDAIVAAGQALSTRDLAVSGHDVMHRLGIGPGRRIGEVMQALLERVTDEPERNTRSDLLALVDELGATSGSD